MLLFSFSQCTLAMVSADFAGQFVVIRQMPVPDVEMLIKAGKDKL